MCIRDSSKAQSDLSAAQRKLSRLHITAPFTGKLIPAKDSDDKDVSFRVGEQVSEGQVIGYMVNDRQKMCIRDRICAWCVFRRA